MPPASSTSLPPLDRPSPFDICPHRAAVAAQHRRRNHPPPGTEVRLSDARRRRAIADAAHLHAALGAARDRGHVRTRITVDSTVRLLKGVQSDVAALSDRNSLEAKTRSVARLGRALPNGPLRRVLQREAEAAESINRLFDHADVVLTRCSQYRPTHRRLPGPSGDSLVPLPTPQRGSSLERHRPARTRGPVRHPQTQPPSLDHFAGLPNDEGTPARACSADAAGRPFPRWSPTPPTINSPGQAIEQPRPSPLTTVLATDMDDVLVARWSVLCCQRTPAARSERRRSASGPSWCRDGLRQLNICA